MSDRDETVGRANETGAERLTLEQLLGALLEVVVQRQARDPDLLSVQEVASALRCSEDTVRRIPRAALPVYRVGKANLYFREDVLAFVRKRGVASVDEIKGRSVKSTGGASTQGEGDVDRFLEEVLGFGTADASKPAERRAG